MESMVNIYLYGKKYAVPSNLTIMRAMEYAGYQLKRGCGCPLVKQPYDIEKVSVNESIMMQLYPEIYSCIGCNACTNACTQELNVMQYIAYAQRGEFEKCAEESFDCVMCGVCSSRCPAGISHPQVALLARRINGKYLAPESKHLTQRVQEIKDGTFEELLEKLMNKPIDEMKELYNNREIEK